jgi:hypothetical protein
VAPTRDKSDSVADGCGTVRLVAARLLGVGSGPSTLRGMPAPPAAGSVSTCGAAATGRAPSQWLLTVPESFDPEHEEA